MLQQSGKKAKSIIYAMHKAYVGHLVVVQPFVLPYVRHVCVLLLLIMLSVRHMHLGLYIWVSMKGRAICIKSYGFSFACAIITRCSGFKLSFGEIIVL